MHASKTICTNGKSPQDIPLSNLIECEWCPEVSANISKAILHKFRKHKGEQRNYHCEYCGKLFPLRCALDQHVRVEHEVAGRQPATRSNGADSSSAADASSAAAADEPQKFDCQFCSAQFVSALAVDFHERNAHRMERRQLSAVVVPPPSKKVKIDQNGDATSLYYCHLCGSEYMLKFNLQQHLERDHRTKEVRQMPADVIQCKACEAIFYTPRAYEVHNLNHRPDDLYVTSEEQRYGRDGNV